MYCRRLPLTDPRATFARACGHAYRRSVDATKSGRIGRLINHSRLQPNLETKLFVVDGVPHLALVATQDILPGVELQYDYGERDPATLAAHPWLLS